MVKYLKKNIKNLIVIAIYIVMFYVVGELLFYIFERQVSTNDDAIFYTVLVNLIIYSVLIISSVILLKEEIITDFKVLQKRDALKIFLACLAGIACVYGGNYIGSFISILFGGDDQSANQQGIEMIMFSSYGVIMVIVTVFVGPIVEELIFRKALHDALRNLKLPTWLILTISSVLFGLIHVVSAGDLIYIFPYIFMGFALGGLEIINDNVYPSIFVHIFNNALATSLMFFMGILEDYIPIF